MLTARQWIGWKVRAKHFPTAIQRADLNAALIRQSCGKFSKVPDLAKLVPRYGQQRRRKSNLELLEAAKARAAARAAKERGA